MTVEDRKKKSQTQAVSQQPATFVSGLQKGAHVPGAEEGPALKAAQGVRLVLSEVRLRLVHLGPSLKDRGAG